MSRDIAKLKRQVEERLVADTARFAAINDSIQKSQDVTKKMVAVRGCGDS